ncbi:hypothetical protein L596_018937 [Steinernema carpocapsae]|uniref:J domain-containing protein n=1 Tax=Steinernema carpocapsae TaxID=34508 RepID=A0A4U5N6N8_STECR|nr:hypothetical protein L596_018937 [Steinernema carpocapsae]
MFQSPLRGRSNTLFGSPLVLKRYLSAHATQNHYDVLGVDRTSSSKQIKAAYYSLSKKYHPDSNNGNKETADKFQRVAAAYEILGSDDKRRAYDATFVRQRQNSWNAQGVRRTGGYSGPGRPAKQYTDPDIDLKTFEHFQRSTRMRQKFHDHWDMPDEFFAEFGGRKFRSRYDKGDQMPSSSNYKDSRAAEREREERKIQEEIERQRKKERYPLPKFEQLIQQEQERKAREQRSLNLAVGAVSFIVLLVVTILKIQ